MKLKEQKHNTHKRRSGEMTSHIFETNKNYVMTHGWNIHKKESDMTIATIHPFLSDQHVFNQWKILLRCFSIVQVLSYRVIN